MRTAHKLKWLLAPVTAGLLVAFIFITADLLFLKTAGESSSADSPASSSNTSASQTGEFRLKENNYRISSLYLPAASTTTTFPQIIKERNIAIPLKPKAETPPEPVNFHLNKRTENLNVLFLGVDGDKLLMSSIYSINHQDKMQSGTVFTPTYALVPGENFTFAEAYKREGVVGVKDILEKQMEISIAYHILIQRAVFEEIETFIDPIYIDGEKVNLADLFTMKVGPKDQEILGALMREFTKPKVFFIKLPKLVFNAKKYVSTDFHLNPKNLMLHYKIAREVDTSKIAKVVLPGRPKMLNGKLHYELLTYPLQNTIYEITR